MQSTKADEGLGLTEVMVAMVLLGIIMMAMITTVVLALNSTASNLTVATAAEAVQQRIEDVRAASVAGDCDVVEGAAFPTGTVTDGRGITYTIEGSATYTIGGTSADSCTHAATEEERDPVQLMRLTVTARSDAPGAQDPVVSTTTDILVKFQP
ncbi:hypothetical protein [Demequina pelophila]|uniref:hypothetical protein n=1 Tax=Demequina pelophila TaxID=1638984 RepID=UPI0007839957|nr:hypothetical protein [Demequina pelophila]